MLLVPFILDLGHEEYHGDESHWLTSSQLATALVLGGDFEADAWQEQFFLYTQPQVGKYAIGIALAVVGVSGMVEVVEYDWLLDPGENRARGAVPPDDHLVAARLPGAVAGWFGALGLWSVGAAVGRPHAGLVGATLLASHPLWLANSRRAGMDAIAIASGILVVVAAIRLARSGDRRWWLAVGATIGLAVATKYTGVLGAAGGALPLAWHARREVGRGRGRRFVSGAAFAGVVALAIAIGTNPALYRDPAKGIERSLAFFRGQAAAMRVTYPAFASPALVAAEIVDRALWPIGFPRIVDVTLEREPGDQARHLVPGQYGTPAVGIGIALAGAFAMLPGAWRSRHRSGLLAPIAATWLAIAFLALVGSLPIWWERWHLGIVPAACLGAAVGCASIGRWTGMVVAGAQAASSLLVGPSYLNHGFWDLLASPWGAGLHAAAGVAIITRMAIPAFLPDLSDRLRTKWRTRTAPGATYG